MAGITSTPHVILQVRLELLTWKQLPIGVYITVGYVYNPLYALLAELIQTVRLSAHRGG